MRLLIRIILLLAPPFFWLAPAAAKPSDASHLSFVPVVYFQFTGVGLAWRQHGEFDIYSGLVLEHGETVLTPADFPAEAFDKVLIRVNDWAALGRFAPYSLRNFALAGPAEPYSIDGELFREVRLSDDPAYYAGKPVNISTRAFVGTGHQVAIAGFAITDYPRVVLVRGVGPSLASHGVDAPVSDPFITIFRRSTPFLESTDWGLIDKDLIIAAALEVSAFPLLDGSKDAAFVVELQPGIYTVHMGVQSGEPGIGLIEVYFLPTTSALLPR